MQLLTHTTKTSRFQPLMHKNTKLRPLLGERRARILPKSEEVTKTQTPSQLSLPNIGCRATPISIIRRLLLETSRILRSFPTRSCRQRHVNKHMIPFIYTHPFLHEESFLTTCTRQYYIYKYLYAGIFFILYYKSCVNCCKNTGLRLDLS